MLDLAAFQERVDQQLLIQLTDPDAQALDAVKVQHALDDAWGKIQGYTFRLSALDQPPEATLNAYHVALTLHVLAGNRPGQEFDTIRNAAEAAIEFLESLKSEPLGVEGTGESPDVLFDDASVGEFGSFEPEETA